jgi:hypothetical protein
VIVVGGGGYVIMIKYRGWSLILKLFERRHRSQGMALKEKFTLPEECISTDQPDKDQCSKHQSSADQRLSTSTKIG